MKPDDEQLPKVPRAKQEIELSAIYWYKRNLPESIQLSEASISVSHLGWGFTGLYGTRGRQDGFISARERAIATGEQYTVIDVRLRMENPILQGRRTADNMADQEILPLHQLAGSYAEDLDSRVREQMHLGKTPEPWKSANSLLDTVALHPSAAKYLLALPEFRHVKVLVHMAKTNLSATPLPVATVRDEHMGIIVQAQCRLDPELDVILPTSARPASRDDRNSDAPILAPVHRGPPRSR